MRAAIYARVSSEAQAERGTIASQLEALEQRAAREGDELVGRFVDDGYSGARFNRPGLDALRDQAEAGVFERVWCLTPDRLARNFAYQMLVVDEFARLGVELRFVDAPPLDDPQARLLVQVQGVIAEYERAHSAERQRRGKLYKVRAGEAIFTKVPYGYRRVPRSGDVPAHLEVYEPEAAVVRRIFDDYVAGGYLVRELARRLYADGVKSPCGRAVWATSTLSPMLHNSTYAGTAYWYRHETVPSASPGEKPKQRRRPKEDWVAVPTPAIISPETFEAVSRTSGRNSAFSPRNAPPDRWLLRGLVVCGPCGVRCSCSRAPTSRGGHNYYYCCAYHDPLLAGGPEKRCHERRVRADELDAFVFQQLRSALLDPGLLTAGQAAVVSKQPLPDDELLAAQLERLERQVAATEAERRRLVDCYQAGLVELPELGRRADDVKARSAHLVAQREQLLAARAELATENRLRCRVADFASRASAGIDALDFAGRQRLMRLVVEEVRVVGWHVEIRLRIPLDKPSEPPRRSSPRPGSGRS